VLLQFCLRLPNVSFEKLADIAKLPGHKLTDTPDLGGNRIWLGSEKLPGYFFEFLFPVVALGMGIPVGR